MQTPEELALEVLPLPACCFEPMEEEVQELADLIRARDAEVRADERAKVLAGFEWDERARAASPYSRVEIQRVLDTGTWIRERRLVGPWEPVADPTEGETDE